MKSRNNFVILLFGFCLLQVKAQWQLDSTDDDSCRTPSGASGSCIPIKTCNYIVRLLSGPRPLPPSTVSLLQSHHCGFSGNSPKVCCPPDTSNPNPIPDVGERDSAEPPDVTGHRNIGLINSKTCGVETIDRIIGGQQTEPFEFPWMALLAYSTRTGSDFKCSGTLINANYILTAAHCITNLDSPLAGVRLGEHDITKDVDCNSENPNDCAPAVQDFAIAEVIPHPQYDPVKLENDIGLLRLSMPADISVESVTPICLPTGNLRKESLVGRKAIVAGWGVTEAGYSSSSLLKVSLPVISQAECQDRYNKTRTQIRITGKQLCAGGVSGKDSCSGDSGGPLKYVSPLAGDTKVVQYGIVSFGPRNCGQTNHPGVYTNIANYMDWILDNMKP